MGTSIEGKWFSRRSADLGRTSKETIKRLCALGLLLLLSSKAACGQEHGAHGAAGSLGTVEFRVSCTAKAQESFTRGIALLHSFTYEESAEAFRDAAVIDPRCAMAHWGLAMTEYHQRWGPWHGPTPRSLPTCHTRCTCRRISTRGSDCGRSRFLRTWPR